MAALDKTISQLYGNSLLRSDTQTSVHHAFTLYNPPLQPQERFFFKMLQLPAFLYISQATLERKLALYGSLLPKLQFTPLDRNFQSNTYLVRSPCNIIPLTSLLQIKKDCRQPLELDFFLKFVQFLSRAYKTIEKQGLPIFNIAQIGINEAKEFLLFDPSLYFTGHPAHPKDYHFGNWLNQMVQTVLQLPLQPEMEEKMLKFKLGSNLNALRPLLEYLRSGNADLQTIQNHLNTKSRFSEETTTQSGSFADVHQLAERFQKENINARKLSFRKMGKLGKIMVLFVIIALVIGVGYFCFRFLTRNVLCQEGEYLDSDKLCESCVSGCIRCSDSQPNSCQRCDLNMYLVLDDEQDKQGFCLSQCRGKLINVGVCVREKQSFLINEGIVRRGNLLESADY